jgi:hypothetical protein
MDVYRYSSFNLGPRWVGLLTPRADHFILEKETRYPLYRRLGGPKGRRGRVRKISPSPGFDPQTVHPVVSRYTDWAILTIDNKLGGELIHEDIYRYTMAENCNCFGKQLDVGCPGFAVNYSPFTERRIFYQFKHKQEGPPFPWQNCHWHVNKTSI